MNTSAESSLTFPTGHNLHSKDTIRIPESHTLHVGPAACARRHAIKALENNDADNMSYLAISEEDLAKGAYEQEIVKAVAALNDMLPQPPHLYLICMKCIDDLLGTDEDALVSELQMRFPSQKFAVQHIDPIALSVNSSPSEKNKASLYSFIEPNQPKDNGVTLVGAFARIPAECEFHQVMLEWDAGPARNILECRTYDDYQALGRSRASVLTATMGEGAALTLQRAGIPYCCAELGYSPAGVSAFYRNLADLMGKEPPAHLERWERESSEALKMASKAAQGRSIVVDSSAALQPFLLTKTLMEYGFTIECVSSKGVSSWEKEAHAWIMAHCPNLPVVRTHSYKALEGDAYHLPADAVVIGADFARTLGLTHAVDMWHDEGFFGFYGIKKLARMIEEALQ